MKTIRSSHTSSTCCDLLAFNHCPYCCKFEINNNIPNDVSRHLARPLCTEVHRRSPLRCCRLLQTPKMHFHHFVLLRRFFKNGDDADSATARSALYAHLILLIFCGNRAIQYRLNLGMLRCIDDSVIWYLRYVST